MEDYRNIMVKYGDGGKKLWPTEFGWPTVENLGVPPAPGYAFANDINEGRQAEYLVQAYQMGRNWGWVGVMFLWNLNFGPVSGAADEKAALKMFQEGRVDALVVTGQLLREVVTNEGKLADELAGKRAQLATSARARVYYMGFCMRDPVVGGERGRKLRQAMSLAFDASWRVDHLYGGAAVVAQGPLPPGVFGHDARFSNPYQRHDLDERVGEAQTVGRQGERVVIGARRRAGGPGLGRAERACERGPVQVDWVSRFRQPTRTPRRGVSRL